MGIERDALEDNLRQMIENKDIQEVGDFYIKTKNLENLARDIESFMTEYHKKHPLEEGISKEELRQKTKTNLDSKNFETMLKNKILTKKIMLQRGLVKNKSFAISLANDQKKIDDIMKKVKDAEPKILKEADIIDDKKDRDVLNYLTKNDLNKVEDFYLRANYLDKLIEQVRDYISKNDKIEVSEFRDISGLSRKQAVAVIEYMDKKNITKRIDDYRVLV